MGRFWIGVAVFHIIAVCLRQPLQWKIHSSYCLLLRHQQARVRPRMPLSITHFNELLTREMDSQICLPIAFIPALVIWSIVFHISFSFCWVWSKGKTEELERELTSETFSMISLSMYAPHDSYIPPLSLNKWIQIYSITVLAVTRSNSRSIANFLYCNPFHGVYFIAWNGKFPLALDLKMRLFARGWPENESKSVEEATWALPA